MDYSARNGSHCAGTTVDWGRNVNSEQRLNPMFNFNSHLTLQITETKPKIGDV